MVAYRLENRCYQSNSTTSVIDTRKKIMRNNVRHISTLNSIKIISRGLLDAPPMGRLLELNKKVFAFVMSIDGYKLKKMLKLHSHPSIHQSCKWVWQAYKKKTRARATKMINFLLRFCEGKCPFWVYLNFQNGSINLFLHLF